MSKQTKSRSLKGSPIPAQGNALGKAHQKAQSPEGATHPTAISHPQLVLFEQLVNASIHELVFSYQYVEQVGPGRIAEGEYESALDCLTTVGLNLDRLQEMLINAQKGRTA